MKRIFKYRLGDRLAFPMPEGAKVLAFQSQRDILNNNETLCLWAEVDDTAPLVLRRFVIVGTGHPVEEGLSYIATAQQEPFVWHLYERTPATPSTSGENTPTGQKL